MKKILLVILLGVIIACQGDPKSDKLELKEAVEDTTAVTEVNEVKPKVKKVVKKKRKKSTKKKSSVVAVATPKKVEIPVPTSMKELQNSTARNYIKDCEQYVANYKKAVESNDMEAFLKLSDESSNLTKQYQSMISDPNLSEQDMKLLSSYMLETTKQLNELSKRM